MLQIRFSFVDSSSPGDVQRFEHLKNMSGAGVEKTGKLKIGSTKSTIRIPVQTEGLRIVMLQWRRLNVKRPVNRMSILRRA